MKLTDIPNDVFTHILKFYYDVYDILHNFYNVSKTMRNNILYYCELEINKRKPISLPNCEKYDKNDNIRNIFLYITTKIKLHEIIKCDICNIPHNHFHYRNNWYFYRYCAHFCSSGCKKWMDQYFICTKCVKIYKKNKIVKIISLCGCIGGLF